jgi:hypothetical protein
MPDHVECPHCRKEVPIPTGKAAGRKPLNIDVTNICDTLRSHRDIALAAKSLHCSRGYIYRELKKHGTTPKEAISKQ